MNKPESIIYHNEKRVFEGDPTEGRTLFENMVELGGEIKFAVFKSKFKCYVCERYHLS